MIGKRAIAAAGSLIALAACTTVLNIDGGDGPIPGVEAGAEATTGDGGITSPGTVIASGLMQVSDVVVFGTDVYFTSNKPDFAIFRVSRAGGNLQRIADGALVTTPSNLVAGAGGIFWGGAGSGPAPGMRRYDGASAPMGQPLATRPFGLAARGDKFFYITDENPTLIWRGDPFAAPSVAAVEPPEHSIALATDGKYLFIATTSTPADPEPKPRVLRAELDGTNQTDTLVGESPVAALAAAPGRVMWATPLGVFSAVPEQFETSDPNGGPHSISSITDAVAITIDERFQRFYFVSASGHLYTGKQDVTTVELSTNLPCGVGRAITRDETDLFVACESTILRVPLLQ